MPIVALEQNLTDALQNSQNRESCFLFIEAEAVINALVLQLESKRKQVAELRTEDWTEGFNSTCMSSPWQNSLRRD